MKCNLFERSEFLHFSVEDYSFTGYFDSLDFFSSFFCQEKKEAPVRRKDRMKKELII